MNILTFMLKYYYMEKNISEEIENDYEDEEFSEDLPEETSESISEISLVSVLVSEV